MSVIAVGGQDGSRSTSGSTATSDGGAGAGQQEQLSSPQVGAAPQGSDWDSVALLVSGWEETGGVIW